MDSHQHEALRRLFHDRRLHPWVPEHDLFIRAELAMQEVLDPSAAANFKAFYEQKMVDYLAAQKAEEPKGEEPNGELTIDDLQKVLEKKEKLAAKEEPVDKPKKGKKHSV